VVEPMSLGFAAAYGIFFGLVGFALVALIARHFKKGG
jgi:hypothetical protein